MTTDVKIPENVTVDLIHLIDSMERELESFKETLEILHDRELMESITRSDEDVKAGRVGVIRDKKDVSRLFSV